MTASIKVTARYCFSASHRLHSDALNKEQNQALYGKCNNPFGHGHNYTLFVTVEGVRDEAGLVVRRSELDALVRRTVIERMDHKNLNLDVPELAALVPTTENLASVVQITLARNWNLNARLAGVRISETDRNTFAWGASE